MNATCYECGRSLDLSRNANGDEHHAVTYPEDENGPAIVVPVCGHCIDGAPPHACTTDACWSAEDAAESRASTFGSRTALRPDERAEIAALKGYLG